MKKIIKDNKPYNIDCEDNICGNCHFKPTSGVNCELFMGSALEPQQIKA